MRMLIFTSKDALQKEIGDLKPLEEGIQNYKRWYKNYVIEFVYFDEKNRFGIKPCKKNPKAIRDFINKAEDRWGKIKTILIIGGDSVAPFFRLPNPCDDDASVLSDNPYASSDDDFLIPERSIARIPENRSAEFIIKQLNKSFTKFNKSFGMSSAVWKEASKNVYKQIGDIRELKISPPVVTENFKAEWLQKKDFLYFNLHGSSLSENWYGQENSNYPVALRPFNVISASGFVASEACYGAYIINKSDRNSLALKFLHKDGITGFCGSTTIACGPPIPPSSEADLLVKYLFEYLKQGLPAGEAFKNAKIDFARKMIRRHGFLDDDDQKTPSSLYYTAIPY
ncbi:MAG: C25 family cysteine peptidase [candidate division WOR-3 bacterium]|nr:C25 family cysteine peptidase [candidate division WOR-3 bacterium]